MAVCGVAGNVTMFPGAEPEPLPPCADEATETVRFRCAEGHERERVVCPTHAAILYTQAPFAPALCLVCSEASGVESRLTPLNPEGSVVTDNRRWVLQEIARDAEADVHRFEGAPFTGKTVAEYMGCQAAAIAALAKVVETLLPDESGETDREEAKA